MARRTKADAESTREAILDAAVYLFYEQGVSQTTLAKIAQQANVTRGAIYWHFDNKADLFNAMLERVRLPFEHLLADVAKDESSDPLQQIRQLMIKCLLLVANNEQHHRILTIVFHRCEFIDELNPAVTKQDDIDARAITVIERAFSRAEKAGLLRHDLSPRFAALSLHMYIRGVISHFLLKPTQCDLAANAPNIVDMMLLGLKKPAC
ncbi:TetR family transcriptional regulator [Rheinheimera sp. WS51]|uniref:TetR family transcriptional regulator n=1 Tax=Rheinheimera sp. WS51 TaxID=3425886 RepID=UPI003D8AA6D5